MNAGSGLPGWAEHGRVRCARWDGGPAEVAKGFLSGWSYFIPPLVVYAMNRAYDPALVEYPLQARINWIWVTFSCGFSLEGEAIQRQLLKPFIDECQRNGVHVSAYISLTNMFPEEMFAQVPEASGWAQTGADGQPVPYGAAHYYGGHITRVLACINQPAWMAYQKRRIDLLLDAGCEGIHVDNCFQNCHCPLCEAGLWEANAQATAAPIAPGRATDAPAASQSVFDEPWRTPEAETARAMYGVRSMARALRDLRSHAALRRPDFILASNAHQRNILEREANALSTEDAREPCFWGDRLVTNRGLMAYLRAASAGWRPMQIESGRWYHGERGQDLLPLASTERLMAECAAIGGTYNPIGDGALITGLVHRSPEALAVWETITRVNSFLAEHEDLYARSEPQGDIAFLMPASYDESLMDSVGEHPSLIDVVLDDEDVTTQLRRYRAAMVPSGSALSAAGQEALRLLEQAGGAVIQLPGCTVEEERDTGSLAEAIAQMPLLPSAEVMGDAGRVVRLMSGRLIDSGQRLVHLINYGDGTISRVDVRLRGLGRPVALHSPDMPAPNLLVERSNGEEIDLSVTNLQTYAVLVCPDGPI